MGDLLGLPALPSPVGALDSTREGVPNPELGTLNSELPFVKDPAAWVLFLVREPDYGMDGMEAS